MIVLAVVVAATAVCADSPSDLESSVDRDLYPAAEMQGAGVPSSATMRFGLEFGEVGSPFRPPHDESFHSYIRVHPNTVVIASGGEVTFEMAARPAHSLGIYDMGKGPAEVDLTNVDGDGLIVDPDDLLFSTAVTTTDQVFQFNAPGRYLIMCRVFGHFVHANMYGWVIVK